MCEGNETRLIDCPHRSLDHNCDIYESIGIACALPINSKYLTSPYPLPLSVSIAMWNEAKVWSTIRTLVRGKGPELPSFIISSFLQW